MSSTDCLSALREQLASGKPNIQLKQADGKLTKDMESASVICIQGHDFPRSTATRYLSAASTADPSATADREFYPLDAIYFAYIKQELPHHEYFQECQRLGIAPVSLVFKRDLFDYLSGKSDSSANIEKSLGSSDAKRSFTVVFAMLSLLLGVVTHFLVNQDTDDSDAKRQKTAGVRVIFDRNNVLSCRSNKSFENIRKMAVDILLRGKKGSAALASEKSATGAGETQVASGSRKLTPIILVPVALTSVITLYNSKSFFEQNQFKSTDEIRKAGQAKQNPTVVKRTNTRTGQTTHYHVYDSVDSFQPEDWDRVVAVFVGGQTWQFQRWRWEDPAELFTNVLGFYLKFSDSGVDSTVKQWNVTVLEINRYKRHLDAQCLHKFWNILDQWMAARKPQLLSQ